MKFAELTKRIKLSPSRKTEYFLKYKSFTDKEKLFLEEMIRISYNLGREDVIQEDIENHKRLFPEPSEFELESKRECKSSEARFDKSNLTGLKSKTVKENLTGLKSERRKSNGTNKSK